MARPCPGLAGLARLAEGRLGAVPADAKPIALAESFDVLGDDVLDALQVFAVGGFGAQNQRARGGLHDALAPAEVDDPAGFGIFDVPDLGWRSPVTAVTACLMP